MRFAGGRMYHVAITTSHGPSVEIDHLEADALSDLLAQWRGLGNDVRITTTTGRRVYVSRRAIVHIVATPER